MSCMLTNMIKLGVLSGTGHHANTETAAKDVTKAAITYVSSRLDIETCMVDSNQQDDLNLQGICYRRLDPAYFAWLRKQIINAQKANKAGRLTNEQWETLKAKFLKLHSLALTLFSEDTLKDAICNFDSHPYQPPIDSGSVPSDWLYPAKQGCWKQSHSVTSQALAMVDAIKAKAMAKGWSEASLYQNRGMYRFPLGDDYGLICHLEGNRTIGMITEKSIEIISHGKSGQQSVMKFYNPDVNQPWIRPVQEAYA